MGVDSLRNLEQSITEVAFRDALMVAGQRLGWMAFQQRYSAPGSGPNEDEVESLVREVFQAAGVVVGYTRNEQEFVDLLDSEAHKAKIAQFYRPVLEPATMFVALSDVVSSVPPPVQAPEPVQESTQPFQPVWEADPESTKFTVQLTGGELDAFAEPAVGPD